MRRLIPILTLSLASCTGCDPAIPQFDQMVPPIDTKVVCGALARQPGTVARFLDPRIESQIGDGLCRPMATAEGWRCLPESPVWDARGTLEAVGAGAAMAYPDLKPLPIFVFQFAQVADVWRTARAYYIRDGRQVCNMLGCSLQIPQPPSMLRVSLLSFEACDVPSPTPTEVQ